MSNSFFNKNHTLNCKGQLISLSNPIVMGIMNITPDSFYTKSRVQHNEQVLERAKQIINQGANIIDIGAYSSRPGAQTVSEEQEWERLEPVIKIIRKELPETILSIDTFRSKIARKAVEHFNVDIINDISAGELDKNMIKTIGQLTVPYIMMHMKGTPQDMQHKPLYEDLMKEIFFYFAQKIDQAKQAGIADYIIDPGFGFGKTLDHNYEILNKLDEFKIFEQPLLVGFSRKSMIYNLLKNTPEQALNGTTVLNTIALTKGANILRVHDVKDASETVQLFIKTKNYSK